MKLILIINVQKIEGLLWTIFSKGFLFIELTIGNIYRRAFFYRHVIQSSTTFHPQNVFNSLIRPTATTGFGK